MRSIPITVTTDRQGKVTFTFNDGPKSFVTLVVVNEQGDTMWLLHPQSGGEQPNSPAEAVGGGTMFVSLRLPAALQRAASHYMPKSDEELMSQFADVGSVIYGAVPNGYEATAPASALLPNARYSVIVLRDTEYATADFRLED